MPKALNDNDNTNAFHCEPDAVMHVVAEKLVAHGFDVCGREWEERGRLTVTNLPGATCEVTVEDHGFVAWGRGQANR